MNISQEELEQFYMKRLNNILARHYKMIIDDKDFSNEKKAEQAEIIEAVMNSIKEVRERQEQIKKAMEEEHEL